MDEDEFQQKLKELCLRCDLQNGYCDDIELAGAEIYEQYCNEVGIESYYREEIERLFDERRGEEPVKEVEYFISNEPIKIGCTVCIYEDVNVVFRVMGMDKGYLYVRNLDGVFKVVESQFKKVGIREKKMGN